MRIIPGGLAGQPFYDRNASQILVLDADETTNINIDSLYTVPAGKRAIITYASGMLDVIAAYTSGEDVDINAHITPDGGAETTIGYRFFDNLALGDHYEWKMEGQLWLAEGDVFRIEVDTSGPGSGGTSNASTIIAGQEFDA